MNDGSFDALSAPAGASGCSPDLNIATAGEFMLTNKNKPNNFIWGELNAGELTFIVENRPKDGKGCPGYWMFGEMMNHFGSSLTAIRGSWTYGDNLAKINVLTTGGGMIAEEAAKHTWTGKRCAQWGFSSVEVLSTTGNPGQFINVQVRFTK